MNPTMVVRRVASTPVRSAMETWQFIIGLLTHANDAARMELMGVCGTAASLIAAEAPRESPMVISGVGARLRVYCLYDEAAILGEEVSEEVLSWNPTYGDWSLSLPCPEKDLPWVEAELERHTSRITARDQRDVAPSTSDADRADNSDLGPIDMEAFLRP